jgi:branched-subunit amino acid aminotransferase/4-amino-4-deoxychorismate lyase
MREVVLRTAARLGIHTAVGDYTLDDLARADACFLTNAVRGIRPVGWVAGVNNFASSEMTTLLRAAIETADE